MQATVQKENIHCPPCHAASGNECHASDHPSVNVRRSNSRDGACSSAAGAWKIRVETPLTSPNAVSHCRATENVQGRAQSILVVLCFHSRCSLIRSAPRWTLTNRKYHQVTCHILMAALALELGRATVFPSPGAVVQLQRFAMRWAA